MKHFLLLIILFFLGAATGAHAQNRPLAIEMVSNPQTGAFRLSEGAFMDSYGFNDTARAVIRLYYSKWTTGRRIMQYAGAPVPFVTVVGKHYESGPYGVGVNYSAYYYDPWVAPVTYSLLGISAFGLIKATKWNRRQLYHAIRIYHATHKLPAQVTPALLVAHW